MTSSEHAEAFERQRQEALGRPPIPELTTYTILLVTEQGEVADFYKAHDKNIVEGALCFIQFYYPTNMHSKPAGVVTRTIAAGHWADVTEPMPEPVVIHPPSSLHIVG